MDEEALPGYPGTAGADFWRDDAALRAEAEPRLAAESVERLARFGALAAGRLRGLVETAHRPEKLPRLDEGPEGPFVAYCPEQVEARRLLAAAAYGGGPRPAAERLALAVLANSNGEGGIGCPFAMTEGLIGLLERRGTSAQKALLPRLRSDDPTWALTGGQFVTERQGGSNVAANEARAEPLPNGAWSLRGEKWFCSNPGEAWVTTAWAGPHIGLFLVLRRGPDGRLNGHRLKRLKPIGGTRGKATVEVEYLGARAELVGKAREGLALLVNEVLSVSRIHVAAAALGFSGRALLEAEAFASWRRAYGRLVKDIPSAAAKLAAMRRERAGMLRVFFLACDALAEGAPDADILVPLAKIEVSRRASALVREAQLLIGGHGILDDFSPLNRLADDAVVNEIWEGTHPILAAHVAKALRRPGALAALAARAPGAAALAGPAAESRAWSEDERSLRDEELAAEAYRLLSRP